MTSHGDVGGQRVPPGGRARPALSDDDRRGCEETGDRTDSGDPSAPLQTWHDHQQTPERVRGTTGSDECGAGERQDDCRTHLDGRSGEKGCWSGKTGGDSGSIRRTRSGIRLETMKELRDVNTLCPDVARGRAENSSELTKESGLVPEPDRVSHGSHLHVGR